jgi:hypothetical protein
MHEIIASEAKQSPRCKLLSTVAIASWLYSYQKANPGNVIASRRQRNPHRANWGLRRLHFQARRKQCAS